MKPIIKRIARPVQKYRSYTVESNNVFPQFMKLWLESVDDRGRTNSQKAGVLLERALFRKNKRGDYVAAAKILIDMFKASSVKIQKDNAAKLDISERFNKSTALCVDMVDKNQEDLDI
jgi:hypothetical protein